MMAQEALINKVDAVMVRSAMAKYVTGVSIVTTIDANQRPAGVTITSFNSLSLSPPLVLWSLSENSSNLEIFKSCKNFAINTLSLQLADLGRKFARTNTEKFKDVSITEGERGVPLIDGSLMQLECLAEAQYPAGDHILFIGRVINLNVFEGDPLIFYNSKFGALAKET